MKTLLGLTFAALFSGLSLAADEPAKDAPVKIEQAEKEMAAGVQLLDVRTPEEWKEGYIKGAKRVGIAEKDFVEKAKATLDPEKPVLVYCRAGGRSAKAAKQLREAGFTTVHDLAGGITAWTEAGKPVEK